MGVTELSQVLKDNGGDQGKKMGGQCPERCWCGNWDLGQLVALRTWGECWVSVVWEEGQ